MLIYAEGGVLHADYSDGQHIIHYTSAVVVPGHRVVFQTAALPNAPSFRLGYEESTPGTLTVTFETANPGQETFHAIASGTLHKKSADELSAHKTDVQKREYVHYALRNGRNAAYVHTHRRRRIADGPGY